MKLAMFGGSFNPIHIGHLALADAVCTELGYDKVAFVPTFISPFKLNSVLPEPKHRLNMIELAIRNATEKFFCEDHEIVEKGVSYTIDTVSYIYEKYKDELEGKIGLLIGSDLVKSFLMWKDADKILETTDVIIGNRPFLTDLEIKIIPDFPHKKLNNIALQISSSLIRQSIEEKKSWRYLVPEAVYEYIITNGLYEKNR
ncbi:MAG: nicotinate (nicotinamide) nucleotide adenylyltransferase [Treponema sp.]|nr:MAG: nicotinate (nicotinamide) nucleotide adenylyltransferase [Treponema sp.]